MYKLSSFIEDINIHNINTSKSNNGSLILIIALPKDEMRNILNLAEI